jgi:hypothetical protein
MREVLFENLKWIHSLKKYPNYRKVIETRQNRVDMEGYNWEEATEAAIHQRTFLLNKLFSKQQVPEQSTVHYPLLNPYTRKFY